MRSQAFAVMFVLCAARPAAAELSRVMVVVVPGDQADVSPALASQEAVPARLAHDERLELVDPARLYAPEDAAESARQLALGKAALEEIGAALGNVDYEGARGKAEAALKSLRGADFRVVRESYLKILLELARIKLALHSEDQGASELAQAFAIDPELAAQRGLNSQERKAFERAKSKAALAPRSVPVLIEAEDVPGWVWLDGRFRGVTPVTVSGLAAGRHFVTFTAPGSRSTVVSEVLGARGKLKVSSAIGSEGRAYRAHLASLQAGFEKSEPLPAAQALLAWAHVDELIVARLATGGFELLRASGRGSARSPLATVEPTADHLSAAIRALLDQPLTSPIEPKPEVRPIEPTPVSSVSAAPPKNRTAGYALLGVGIAAIAAGAFGEIYAPIHYNTVAQAIPQADTGAYASAVGLSNWMRFGGLGLLAAGLVCAGLGLSLLW